jgi:cyclase
MLRKRIIPCLDVDKGRVVKGIQFMGLRDAGDPVQLAIQYAAEGADELVFLDITATNERRNTFPELVKKIAAAIDIPFTVGGGISTTEDVYRLLAAGADKVSVNTAAILRPRLVTELANRFGSQCIVVAVDVNQHQGAWEVYRNGGKVGTGLCPVRWAQMVERRGAGELLLTSMFQDGRQSGFSLDITQRVAAAVSIPVIASGGAGTKEDVEAVFRNTDVTAALAASIFHYGKLSLTELKKYLKQKGISVRYEN